MTASVAVLSDVHGVLPVLEAVLAEPDVRSADLVVVTGDHAAGPMPVETLDLLVSLGERGVLVRGNADRELVAVTRGEPCEHPESVWAASLLTSLTRKRVLAPLRASSSESASRSIVTPSSFASASAVKASASAASSVLAAPTKLKSAVFSHHL